MSVESTSAAATASAVTVDEAPKQPPATNNDNQTNVEETKPDDTTTTTTPTATIIPRMKKVRKRGAFKSSLTPLEDDREEAGGESTNAGEGEAKIDHLTHLQAIRAIQDLRHKKSSAFQLGEHTLLLPDRESAEAAAAAAEESNRVDTTSGPNTGQEFGSESVDGKDVQAALVEKQMEKYIAEQLAARRALRQPQNAPSSSSTNNAANNQAPNLSEAQLFVTPAHLAIHTSTGEVEEAGERWLTGISEQPLSIKDKMANIEKTERAKAAFLAAEAARRNAAANLVLPANFNANFKLHKKEWDGKRRDEFRTFLDAQNRQQALAQGLPAPPPSAYHQQSSSQTLVQQASALPGFLAGGDAEKREMTGRHHHGGGGGGPAAARGGNVPSATDDKVVDRFIKRFKYK